MRKIKPAAAIKKPTVAQALMHIADAIRGHGGESISGTVLPIEFAALPKSPRFTKLGDDMVRDNTTGLIWHAATTARDVNHAKAINACADLRVGGHSDWRLPTVEELRALVDYTRHSPAIDTDFFKETDSSYYWTSTAYAADPAYAWVVYFYDGVVNYFHRYLGYPARAVRGPVSP